MRFERARADRTNGRASGRTQRTHAGELRGGGEGDIDANCTEAATKALAHRRRDGDADDDYDDDAHLDLDIVDGLFEAQNRATDHRREDGSREVGASEAALDELYTSSR